jgi:hypothetical protein
MALSESEYIQQVLEPARKAGNPPDYFARYELSLNEQSLEVIEQAAVRIQRYWNKAKVNTLYTKLANTLLKEHPEALAVLKNAERRRIYAKRISEEREQQRQEREKALDRDLQFYAGTARINRQQLDALIRNYPDLGADAVRKRISQLKFALVESDEQQSKTIQEGFEHTVRQKLRENLSVLKKKTLYDFLGVQETANEVELAAAYQRSEEEWSQRANDATKATANELLGLIKTRLLVADGKQRYAQARQYDALEDVRERVRIAAQGGIITLQQRNQLIQDVVRRGLTQQQAEEVLRDLARQVNAGFEVATASDNLLCPNCSTLNPETEQQRHCRQCGSALYLNCPKCSREQRVDNVACSYCGFRFTSLPHVTYLFAEARNALQSNNLQQAQQALDEIKTLWGDTNEALTLRSELAAALAQRNTQGRELSAALAQQRFYAARRLLHELERRWPDYQPTEQSLPNLRTQIENTCTAADELVRQADAIRAAGRDSEALSLYERALGMVYDHETARQRMQARPPEPPGGPLQATSFGIRVSLDWPAAPATGNLGYRVVRKIGSPVTSPTDGEVLAQELALLRFEDAQPPAGVALFYAVYSERFGTLSLGAATAAPLLIAAPIMGLNLELTGEGVRGTWQTPARQAEVQIMRQREDQAEPAVALRTRSDGTMLDTSISDGATYRYDVVCIYNDQLLGRQLSQTVTERIEVLPPPEPVLDLLAEAQAEQIVLRWTPPERGEVLIYRLQGSANTLPPLGKLVRVAELAALGTPLKRQSPAMASDADLPPPAGEVRYLPMTVAGERAVAGREVVFVRLLDVRNVQAIDRGSYIEVTWLKGDNPAVEVAWSYSGPPSRDGQNQQSQRIYGQATSCRIEAYTGKPIHIAVFAAHGDSSNRRWASAATADSRAFLPGRASLSRVRYRVQYKRALFGAARISLQIERLDGQQVLPELRLVAKRGENPPLRPDDGTALIAVPAESVAPFQHEVDPAAVGMRSPFTLRLHAAPGQQVEIEHPPPASLHIK